MDSISIIIPSYRTRDYLPLAIRSARENLASPDHEIIVIDDASEDGSWEWLEENQARYDLVLERTEGPRPRGLVYTFDEAAQSAKHEAIWYVHPDMVLGPDCDQILLEVLEPGFVVCPTRIEPPLFPPSPALVHRDWGTTADTFAAEEFARHCRDNAREPRLTHGIFSPFLCLKRDFFGVGGHDRIFAPFYREDSDLYNRLALAGCRFRQSWAAYVYHFIGRSGRAHSDPAERARWSEVSKKNDRVFVRRLWGALPNVTGHLAPVPLRRIPIALEVNLRNERRHVVPFFDHLEAYFEELIVVDDESTDGSIDELRAWIDERAATDSAFRPERFRIVARPLRDDFAAQVDFGSSLARSEWILHADLDERFDSALLESLQCLVRDLDARGLAACGFPRLNYLDGVLANDIPRKEWTQAGLAAHRDRPPVGEMKNPDFQFRLVRRGVGWFGRVHEKPRPCFEAPSLVTIDTGGVIRHEKTTARQGEQDLAYARLQGLAHGDDARRLRWLLLDTEDLLDPSRPPPVPGFTANLARALARLGQEVHVLRSGRGRAASVRYQDVHAIHLAGFSPPVLPPSPVTYAVQESIALTEAAIRLHETYGSFDLVHALHWTDALVARSIRRATSARLLVTRHRAPYPRPASPEDAYVAEMDAWLAGEADAVVSGSPQDGIPPGIDPAPQFSRESVDLLLRRLLPGPPGPVLTVALRGPASIPTLGGQAGLDIIFRRTTARIMLLGLDLGAPASLAVDRSRGVPLADVREPVLSQIFAGSTMVVVVDPLDATGHLARRVRAAGTPVHVLRSAEGIASEFERLCRPGKKARDVAAGPGWPECAQAYLDLALALLERKRP